MQINPSILNAKYIYLDWNVIKYMKEPRLDKGNLDNIIIDGNNCLYASKGQYFVSEDAYTRKKTAFLYSAYDIKTKVVSEAEFLNYFDF